MLNRNRNMDIKNVEREVFKFSFRRYVSKVEEMEMGEDYYDDYKEQLESFIKTELLRDKKIKEVRKVKMDIKTIIKIDSFTEKYLTQNY